MATPTDPPADEDDFATLLAESQAEETRQRRLSAGDVVRGRVIAIGPETAFVALGAKSEAVIDLAELRDPSTGELTLAVGDELEATVTDTGEQSGSVVLKRTLGRGAHVPGELEQAAALGLAVEGVVTGRNKGGFDVQVAGVRAFCPASQIDLRRGDPAQYVGQRLRFLVSKASGRDVVVSRRSLLEEEARAAALATWERLKPGIVVKGTVTSLRDFGAFVDLGGLEGLIHLSELGFGRPQHPSEVLQVGQEVEAKVLKIEPGSEGKRARISLSLRALAPDPWDTAAKALTVGSTVRGRVRRLEQFGAFVELAPGVDGLLHVSKLTLDRRVSHPKQVVSEGQEVEVTITAIDRDKRRIGLSMVETARRQRDASERAERVEEQQAMAKTNERSSLGTFADLLAASKKKT